MYSPTTRLLTILELLQAYPKMSGAELARRLEVDPRTVRRYILMLQDIGIPIEAERGPYGAYRLQRGYKMPPLMFTDEEAMALSLGLLVMREFRFPVQSAAVEGALAKTERVMPEKLLKQMRALQEAIRFNVLPPPVQTQNVFLARLSSAVQQRQQVHLHYRSFQEEETERDFDPYGIVYNQGYWYTAGYCHLRQGLRIFPLDRVIALQIGEGSFEIPEAFDVREYVLNALVNIPGNGQIEVLLKTSIENAQQVIASDWGTLEATDQGVLFRRAAYPLEWIAHFLISLDFPIVVRHPPELRESLRQLAQRAREMAEGSANEAAANNDKIVE